MKFYEALKNNSLNICFFMISLIYILFINKYRYILFSSEFQNSFIFQIISDLIIIISGQAVCNIIKGIKNKNTLQIRYFVSFLILFSISFILYLSTDFASFNWKMWDAYSVYESALKHSYINYLHLLTVFYYITALNIFPFKGGIILFQIIISSTIFSYIWSNLCGYIKYKYKWILLLPLFFFPVLRMGLQPIRSCIYYVFILLFFAIFYFKYKENKQVNFIEIIFLAVLSSIVCVWRSENIPLFLIVPLFLLFIGNEKVSNIKKVLFLIIFYSITIFINNTMLNAFFHYRILPFKRPLAAILRTDFNTNNKEQDLYIISKCCSLDGLKNLPLNETILAKINYYPEFDDVNNYVKTAIKLILLNPVTYLKERADLTQNFTSFQLLSDGINEYNHNSLISKVLNTLELETTVIHSYYLYLFSYMYYIILFFIILLLLYSIKNRNKYRFKIAVVLLLTDILLIFLQELGYFIPNNIKILNILTDNSFKFVYSPVIPYIFIVIANIYSCFKRNKMLFLITFTSLLLSLLSFLLCAEPFFHYFLQSYVLGWYIFAYTIMVLLNKIRYLK